MYTPFLAYLMQHVGVFEEYARNSEASDQGTVSGMFRSPELSKLQQNAAKEIYDSVKKIHLKPENSKDEQTYNTINLLLKKLQKATLTGIETYNLSLSFMTQHLKKTKTGFLRELEVFITHLEESYKYFKKYQLLNVHHEGTPLVMFKTHLIDYLVYRAAHKTKLGNGYYTWTGTIKNLTYDNELAAQKERLVLSFLDNDALIDSRDHVRRYINDVRNGDGQVLEQKAIKGMLPAGYGVVTANIPVKYQYTPYKLNEKMTSALHILDSSKFDPIPEIQLSHFLKEDHRQSPPSGSASRSSNSHPVRQNDDDDDNDDFLDCESTSNPYFPTRSGNGLTQANLQKLNAEQGSSDGNARKGTFSVTYSEGGDSQAGLD